MPTPKAVEAILDDAFQAANNAIKDMSERMGNDMGTTLVAAIVYKNELALVANVGDSRAYLMRNSVIHQITRDHSLVARMVEQNRITPERRATIRTRTSCCGRSARSATSTSTDLPVELEKNDRSLLCSDGLWGEVEDEVIEDILTRTGPARGLSASSSASRTRRRQGQHHRVVVVLMPEGVRDRIG
jgi:protein phosphatase